MPKTGKTVDPSLLEEQMDHYMTDTVKPFVDGAFDATDDPECGHQAQRGDHIIIDGKTAYEIAVEEYRKTLNGKPNSTFRGDFQKFYKKNGKDIINRQLAAALAEGKRVEVFVPDPKTGKIPKEPGRLTKSGYDPNSPLVKPRQLSRWKRFWNKFGFYKKETAEYRTEQAEYDRNQRSRERVQFYNKATRASSSNLNGQRNEMVRQWTQRYENRKNVDLAQDYAPYRLSRQAFVSFTNIVLARQKGVDGKPLYSNEKLFDMNDQQMIEARSNAAEEVFRHAEKKDGKWLAELLHDSKTVLTERINEQGKKVNFAHSDLTEQKSYQVLNMLSLTSFDVSQEIGQVKEELDKAYGPDEYADIAFTMGELPNVLKFIPQSMSSQRELATGAAGDEKCNIASVIGDVMAGQVVKQHFTDMQKKIPPVPFQQYYQGRTTNVLGMVSQTAGLENYELQDMNLSELPPLTEQARELQTEYFEDHETFAKQVADGVLEQRVKLQNISDNPKTILQQAVTTELDSPGAAEKNLRDIKAKELREEQRTNAQVLA